MAEIVKTSLGGTGARVVTVTTLGASDTLVFDEGKNGVLTLVNGTGGALTPLIVGDGASTAYGVPGVGSLDLSSGEQLASVADGTQVAIPLDSIRAKLKGVITITGADAMAATLTEY